MTPTTERPTLRRDERGIALAIAIFALVIIATLVTGVFFMARLEQRSGNNALWSTQAAEAADAGLNATLANWSSSYNSIPTGNSQTLATVTFPGNVARYTPVVMKVSDQIFLVQSRGERIGGGGVLSSTVVGKIVRMALPDLQADAALTSKGGATVGGNSFIDGRNTVPEGWAECPTSGLTDKPGIRTDAASVKASIPKHVQGSPPVVTSDAGVTDDLFIDAFNSLLPLVNKPLTDENMTGMSPSLDSGVCNASLMYNWGEPYRNPPVGGAVTACNDYFPIMHRVGDLKVQTGRGQGILLVTGDFHVRGNFIFNGIVIALGEVKGNGTGNKITGAVFAYNSDFGDETSFIGNPQVRYSSCAISQVLAGAARAVPLAERSWVQLY